MPDYLDSLPKAQAIWFEELERVVAHGITADHSSTFASYCVIEAGLRAIALTGVLPNGNVFMERRKLAELLGIGGLSSRTSGKPVNPLVLEADPYAGLPDA